MIFFVNPILFYMKLAAAAKSLQSFLTLCDLIDSSPPGSRVPGILQARTLEWFAISFSNAWKWKVKVKSLSRVRPSATRRTAAFQAPPSMGECWTPYKSLPYPAESLQQELEDVEWEFYVHTYAMFLEGDLSLLHWPAHCRCSWVWQEPCRVCCHGCTWSRYCSFVHT